MIEKNLIPQTLLADHQRLHQLLSQAQGKDTVITETYNEFRQGLMRHIAIEEKIFFPEMKKIIGTADIWRTIRIEHAALTSLLVPTPDLTLLNEIHLLLLDHDSKEEGSSGIYAEGERILTPELRQQLSSRAEALPPIPMCAHIDSPNVHRTRASALASANKLRMRG